MKDKILIIEDDFANGITALMAMDELGFDAILVSNAEEGIEMLNEYDFLAVLSDMNMPLKKGSSVDKEAGKFVIKECINMCVPSAIVTGGGIGHHGVPCIKVLLPEPMLAFVDYTEVFSLNKTREIDNNDKSIEAWKQAWGILKEFANSEILCARQRYRKYIGKPFCLGQG